MESLRNKGQAWLAAWVGGMLKMPALIVGGALIAVFFALTYTVGNIGVYTDTAAMLSEDLPFRRSYETYRQSFPQLVDMFVVVVDAPTSEGADAAARELADHLRDRPDLYADVFLPGDDAFFRHTALLYQDEATLDELAERLDEARPLIAALTRNQSLSGLAAVTGGILAAPDAVANINAVHLVAEMDRALAADLIDKPYDASWRRILAATDGDDTERRYLFAKPFLDFTEPLAAEAAISHIRRLTSTLAQHHGATVRITGDAALSYEELTIALGGARLTGILALVMVTGVLLFGLRSGWLALACVVNLLAGLSLTAAFATAAVGNLNLISLAFAVLYIGLGADYAIHLTLRYRERLLAGDAPPAAILYATIRMAGPLLLCTLTTASGFFAFLPTSFSGVSELGLIAGTGMFINLVLSLTMLPGLLALMPAPRIRVTSTPATNLAARSGESTDGRWRLVIRSAAIALGIAAVLFLPRLEFDFDALNLRPADAESVATLRDLMRASDTPPFHITVLATNLVAAGNLQRELRALPAVSDAQTIADLVPHDTARKRVILREIDASVGPLLQQTARSPAATADRSLQALGELKRQLVESGAADHAPIRSLAVNIDQFLALMQTLDGRAQTEHLARLESRWLGQLRPALTGLAGALDPPLVSLDSLPAGLRNRWISAGDTVRIAVYPREDVSDRQALRRFVRAVQTVAPDATDEPVLSVEAGDAVVGAFRQAFTWSIVAIAVLLTILVRRLSSVVLIMMPLLLAGLLTMGVMGLFGIPFNFANVIALPLLFGIGVDNGVHIVQRARENGGTINPMRTSTSRGVLLSMLTTICGFGNLLMSPHPGTATIGLVLTIGISITLFCTLVVLPAWLPRSSTA